MNSFIPIRFRMPWIDVPGIGNVHVRLSKRTEPNPMCSWCKKRRSSKLCDFPLKRGTCDQPLCIVCAEHVGDDKDYCPNHAYEGQKELFG